MLIPTPAQLLGIWERGDPRPAAARALLLLEAAGTETDSGRLALLPLGRRDSLLLDLRARLFGPEVTGVATCPQCAGRVEAVFLCADLQTPSVDANTATDAPDMSLDTGGLRIRYRLPDSSDMLALAEQADASAARALLIERCVLEVQRGKRVCDVRDLPADAIEAISQAMADTDPQADLRLAFTCPDCTAHWECAFDIVQFLWQELRAYTQRLLREVDVLARTYHWREADILAMAPQRRQTYLELCTA